MVDAESAPLEQVVKQLDKLINVVEIRDLDPSESVERELMMVIVSGQPKNGARSWIWCASSGPRAQRRRRQDDAVAVGGAEPVG